MQVCWFDRRGQLCAAGVPAWEIAEATARPQICTNCCWAAAVSYVLAHAGADVPQEDVVWHVFGDSAVDAPVGDNVIVDLLNTVWADRRGRNFTSVAWKERPNLGTLLEDLRARRPVLVATDGEPVGHVMLATAWVERPVLVRDPFGRLHRRRHVEGLIVRDPALGRRFVNYVKWRSVRATIRVRVERGAQLRWAS